MRNKAKREIMEDKPDFIIGSVMCTDWSIMQNCNKKHFTDEEWQMRMGRAKSHLKFICELYKIQTDGGRYFVHEHPTTASSWAEQVVTEIMGHSHAWDDMCRFGMTTERAGHSGLSLKPTDFMTNSVCVADQLDRRCLNMGNIKRDHDHVQLDDGRPKHAQQYPPELCRAI